MQKFESGDTGGRHKTSSVSAGANGSAAAANIAATTQPVLASWRALRADVPSALLAILLLLIPLYRTRILEDSFNTPKLALAMGMAVLAAIGLLARPQSSDMKLRWYPVPWLLIGLAVWQALSVLWSQSKPLGVDGTVYFATFSVLGWLFYRGPQSVSALHGLFHAAACAAVMTAGWVLFDDFSGGTSGIIARLPDWRGYLAAGLGNSGHIAGMVGMFLPWVLLIFLRAQKGWLMLPALVLMFAAMTVTWSVGSSSATIISLLIWGGVAVQCGQPGFFHWKRLIGAGLAGLLVIAFYFLPSPANPHKPSLLKEAFGSARWEAGWPTRVVIWETTWQMIRQDPMIGVGTGNFTYDYTQEVVPALMDNPVLAPYAGAFTNDAHNDYMQLWAEGGVLALALWMAILWTFYGTVIKMLRKASRDNSHTLALIGAGAGLTVFVLDGLMSFPMRLPSHFCMAMFFLSVPGVLGRLQVPASADLLSLQPALSLAPLLQAGPTARRRARSLRAGGIGILLTLAACVWHHGHRVMAEYYLKMGRDAAGGAMVSTGSDFVPLWNGCDQIYQQTLQTIASGGPASTWQSGVAQMQKLSDSPALQEARAYFEKSLASDRWYSNASSRLGQLLLFRGDFEQSMDITRRTLKTLQAFEIHERMGAAAFFSGNYKTAQEHWLVCLNRRPEMAAFYKALLARVPR